MMIILHGFAASNYYNLVKHVLLYKQLPFQENLLYGRSDALLAISPAGKVPVITTTEGLNLSESSVICHFLEEAYPASSDRALYPEDSAQRARVRQIMKIAELYLELPSRRFIPYVLSGRKVPTAVKGEVRDTLSRGIHALAQLAPFSPWIAGEQFSMADIYVYYVNTIVSQFGARQLDWNIMAEVPGMQAWNDTMSQSAIAQQVEADRQANMPEFLHTLQAQFQAARAK